MRPIVPALVIAAATLVGASWARADDVGDRLAQASSAYGRGDLLRTLESVQAVQGALTGRLVEQFAKAMPPAPTGWEATAADSQPLDQVGGGLTITRGYQKGEATLNASLLIDNPAVANIAALFQPGSPPPGGEGGWKTVTIGGDAALLRFDAGNHEGEVVLAIQGRAALQIEGGEIADEKILMSAAQGWNIALIKKLLGS
jgi:hypothetical protein